MKLFTVVCVISSILPVDDGVKSLALLSRFVFLGNSFTGLPKSQLHTRVSSTVLDRFEKETPDLGNTMWAGYNALTHWATHTDETIEKEIDNKSEHEIPDYW